jgi:D-psicose/D-tagatose/L-ribulose 3-epimerase
MKLSLCNEVIRELPFAHQCEVAAKLGYTGLEIAPFTLGDDAYRMSTAARAELRRAMADNGLVCSGLHWLLVAPKGLSITTPDTATWNRTLDVMKSLVELCAELGGAYLVHGSPAQRMIAGQGEGAAARAEAAWAAVAGEAARAKVVYCIEPLAKRETDFVNTVAEAAAIVRRIDSPGLRTMIDTSAAALSESDPVADVVARWLPQGLIAHVQLNDRNRRGPGEGSDRFAPVIAALARGGYDGWLAMEPFDYVPDGPTCAARCIGYVQALLETQDPGRA